MTALEPRDAVIVAARRTPIGRRGGGLRNVRPDDLAAGLVHGRTIRLGDSPVGAGYPDG